MLIALIFIAQADKQVKLVPNYNISEAIQSSLNLHNCNLVAQRLSTN